MLRVAIVVAVLLSAGAAGAGGRKGGKLGVKRLSEFRSGRVVTGQIVDLAPGFGRVPGRDRIGRDHRGARMAVDDATPGQLLFRNKRADGLPVTEVRTWDGAARRWIHVKVGKPDAEPAARGAAEGRAAFIRPQVVRASGKVARPIPGIRSLQLRTYYGRSSNTVRLALDLYNTSGMLANYHLEVALDSVNEALETGLPIDDGAWTITADAAALELRRHAGTTEVIRIDRDVVDQVWAEADRVFPLAD